MIATDFPKSSRYVKSRSIDGRFHGVLCEYMHYDAIGFVPEPGSPTVGLFQRASCLADRETQEEAIMDAIRLSESLDML